ncbi:MAG: hypothetical protein QNK23_00440 [Crocinitomicaceae bacterium]|nr:hypothetical protein [Crocinitomicaceae bacterium]
MKSVLTITLLLLSTVVFGQEDDQDNNFYARIGVYELSLGYERKVNSQIGVAVEVDYRPRFKNEAHVYLDWGSMNVTYQGFRIKPIVNYYHKTSSFWSFFPSYRYLESGTMINDEGKFGGSNYSDYDEYSQKNHEIGINALFNSSFKKHPAFSLYFGAGVSYKYVDRQYTIEGTWANKTPSDRVETLNVVFPSLYFGIKWKFVRF